MNKIALILSICLFLCTPYIRAQAPVNLKASPEAIALLKYIYSISGKQILTGQHAAPLMNSIPLSVIHRNTQNYPALFGQDFGFSYPGYWDGANFRQRIVDEAIIRHEQGFIITLMWHAVVPTLDEPVTFKPGVLTQGSDNHLTQEQWQELVTEGTHLNERWKSQVDVIAWFLKQLKYANIPVLWRPYHEMNGSWFWWGQREGKNGYEALWKMMYQRFTEFHGLDNLIWVYNTNEVKKGVNPHAAHYPGNNYVDIIATDVYTEGFNQINYDSILELAGDKPVALGEVGQLPDIYIIHSQPRWCWFMRWGMPEGASSDKNLMDVYENNATIKLKNLPWAKTDNPRVHYPMLID